ncbi:MAG TPA: DUF6263 family protein [Candidatus Kapabacteria bacterium]|nr:DUF6263 family protein [Candidatus Kapabacteria bacterium]
MYKIIIVLILCGLSVSFAQEKTTIKPSKNIVKYTLKSNFPVNVQHLYELIDTSKTTRIFSDSTSQTYDRVVKYYFSVWASSAPSSDKVQEVSVSVDSLEYTMYSGGATVFYNSQSDDIRPPKIDDFNNYVATLGLEFDLAYSAYDEVGDIKGSLYESKINMLKDPKTMISDSILSFVWNDKLGKASLTTYFDVVKNIYPQNKVAIDSTWIKNINYDLEGATISDSVQFVLKNFNMKNYIIEGSTINAHSLANDQAVLGSIRSIAHVIGANGHSNYNIKLSLRGNVEELNIISDFDIDYKIRNDSIKQKVHSSRTWKLFGMYKI